MGKYGFQYIAREGMQVGRDGQVTISVDGAKIRVGVTQSLASKENYESIESQRLIARRLKRSNHANDRSFAPLGFSTHMRSPVTTKILASTP